MGLRERVALALLAVIILQITCTLCMPRSMKKNAIKDLISNSKNVNNNHASPPQPIQVIKSSQTDKSVTSTIDSPKDRSIYKVIHFPEVEYPSFNFAEGQTSWRYKDCTEPTFPFEIPDVKITDPNDSNFFNNLRKEAKKKRKQNAMTIKEKENSNQNAADILSVTMLPPELLTNVNAFPEVEYPLTASETWKPNYWIQYTYPLTEEPIKIVESSLPNVVKQNEITFFKPLNKTKISKPQQKELNKSARILSSLDNINKLNTTSGFTPKAKTKNLRSKNRNSKVTRIKSNASKSPKINLNNFKNITNSPIREINETNNTLHVFSLIDDDICLVDNKTEFDDKDTILDSLYSNLYPPLPYQNIHDPAEYQQAGYYDIVSLEDDAQKKSHMYNVAMEKKGHNSSAPITIVVIPFANTPINIDDLLRGIFGNSVPVSQSINKSVPVNVTAKDTESIEYQLNKEMSVAFNSILNNTDELLNEIIRFPNETISDFVSGGLPIETMPVTIEQILHSPSEGLQSKMLTVMVVPTSSLGNVLLPTEELPAAVNPVSSLSNEGPTLEVISATIDPVLSLSCTGIPPDDMPLENRTISSVPIAGLPNKATPAEINSLANIPSGELMTVRIPNTIDPKSTRESLSNFPNSGLTNGTIPDANNLTSNQSSAGLLTSALSGAIDSKSTLLADTLSTEAVEIPNNLTSILLAGEPSSEVIPAANNGTSSFPIEEVRPAATNLTSSQISDGFLIPVMTGVSDPKSTLETDRSAGEVQNNVTPISQVREPFPKVIPATTSPTSNLLDKGVTTDNILLTNKPTLATPIRGQQSAITNDPISNLLTNGLPADITTVPTISVLNFQPEELTTDMIDETANMPIGVIPAELLPSTIYPTSNSPTRELLINAMPGAVDLTSKTLSERLPITAAITSKLNLPLGALPGGATPVSVDLISSQFAEGLLVGPTLAATDPTSSFSTSGVPVEILNVPIDPTPILSEVMPIDRRSSVLTGGWPTESMASPIVSKRLLPAPMESVPTIELSANVTLGPIDLTSILRPTSNLNQISNQITGLPIGESIVPIVSISNMPMEAMLIPRDTTSTLPAEELQIDTTAPMMDSLSSLFNAERRYEEVKPDLILNSPTVGPFGEIKVIQKNPAFNMPIESPLYEVRPGPIQQTLNLPTEGLLPEVMLVPINPSLSFLTEGHQLQAMVDFNNHSLSFPNNGLLTEIMPVLIDPNVRLPTWSTAIDVIPVLINSSSGLPTGVLLTDVFFFPNNFKFSLSTNPLTTAEMLLPGNQISNLCPAESPTGVQQIPAYLTSGSLTELPIEVVSISSDSHILNDGYLSDLMLIPINPSSNIPKEALLIDPISATMDPTSITPTGALPPDIIPGLFHMKSNLPSDEIQVILNSMPGSITELGKNSLILPNIPTISFVAKGCPPKEMTVLAHPTSNLLDEVLLPRVMTISIDPVTDRYNDGFVSDGTLDPMYKTTDSQGEGILEDKMLNVGLCSNTFTTPISNKMPQTESSPILIGSTSNLLTAPIPNKTIPLSMNSTTKLPFGGQPIETIPMPVPFNSITNLTEGGMPPETLPVSNNITPRLPTHRLLDEVMPTPIDLKPITLTERKPTQVIQQLTNSTVILSSSSLPAEGKHGTIDSILRLPSGELQNQTTTVLNNLASQLHKENELAKLTPVRKNLTSNPTTKDLQGKSIQNKQLASFDKELADIPIEEELLPVHPTDKAHADLIEQKNLQPVRSTAINTVADTKLCINNTAITSVALHNNTNKQSSDEASLDNKSNVLSKETDKFSLPVNKQSSREELPFNTNNTSNCNDLPNSEELLPAYVPSDISDYTAMPFETTDIWTTSADDSTQLYTIADISLHKEIHHKEDSSDFLRINDLPDYTTMPFGT